MRFNKFSKLWSWLTTDDGVVSVRFSIIANVAVIGSAFAAVALIGTIIGGGF